MNKSFYYSKTFWGLLGGAAFGLLDVFTPSPVFRAIALGAFAFAGYGMRMALK